MAAITRKGIEVFLDLFDDYYGNIPGYHIAHVVIQDYNLSDSHIIGALQNMEKFSVDPTSWHKSSSWEHCGESILMNSAQPFADYAIAWERTKFLLQFLLTIPEEVRDPDEELPKTP